jgi:hypothetical protein
MIKKRLFVRQNHHLHLLLLRRLVLAIVVVVVVFNNSVVIAKISTTTSPTVCTRTLIRNCWSLYVSPTISSRILRYNPFDSWNIQKCLQRTKPIIHLTATAFIPGYSEKVNFRNIHHWSCCIRQNPAPLGIRRKRLDPMETPPRNTITENNLHAVHANETSDPTVQPLYITIGPPCAGKTTWIRWQSSRNDTGNICDICIDDQPGVYYALPTQWFLPNNNDQKNNLDIKKIADATTKTIQKDSMIFGKTVGQRIQEQIELCAVLGRLANVLSAEEFQKALTSRVLPSHATILIDVVEAIVKDSYINKSPIQLPPTIDLFVREAIFRSPSSTDCLFVRNGGDRTRDDDTYCCCSAIKRTEQLLYDTSKFPLSSPLAWGNTNTRPSDFTTPLAMAAEVGRPVYFVVFFDDTMKIPQFAAPMCSTTVTIPSLDSPTEELSRDEHLFDLFVDDGYKGLVRRNIDRLMRSGRYIPTSVIWDMRDRTIEFIDNVMDTWQQQLGNNGSRDASSSQATKETVIIEKVAIAQSGKMKLEFHQCLARIAGFDMNEDRIVTARSSTDPRIVEPAIKSMTKYHSNEQRQHLKRNHYNDDINRRVTGAMNRQQTWDRPASAVRGYHPTIHSTTSPQSNNTRWNESVFWNNNTRTREKSKLTLDVNITDSHQNPSRRRRQG